MDEKKSIKFGHNAIFEKKIVCTILSKKINNLMLLTYKALKDWNIEILNLKKDVNILLNILLYIYIFKAIFLKPGYNE